MVKHNRRRYIVYGFIIAVLLLVLTIGASYGYMVACGNEGVRAVWVAEALSGDASLKIRYTNPGSSVGYTVRPMEDDEGAFLGNKLVENDDALGTYRVEILFHNVKGGDGLIQKYPLGEVHPIGDTPYNIRVAYPPDDSLFVIYIGSDQPLAVEEQGMTYLKGLLGTITIPF